MASCGGGGGETAMLFILDFLSLKCVSVYMCFIIKKNKFILFVDYLCFE